jgi:hypothetical protein
MGLYYRTLIGRIYTYTSVDCYIIMHTYDYAIPDGRGVFGKAGGSNLPSAMRASEALQQDCVRYLLDAFHEMLKTVAALKKAPAHRR